MENARGYNPVRLTWLLFATACGHTALISLVRFSFARRRRRRLSVSLPLSEPTVMVPLTLRDRGTRRRTRCNGDVDGREYGAVGRRRRRAAALFRRY